MKPRLMRSELTGRVYVVTRYKIDPKSGLIQAQSKSDVTDEFNALLEAALSDVPEPSRNSTLVPFSDTESAAADY